jgi:hypothetical protein
VGEVRRVLQAAVRAGCEGGEVQTGREVEGTSPGVSNAYARWDPSSFFGGDERMRDRRFLS